MNQSFRKVHFNNFKQIKGSAYNLKNKCKQQNKFYSQGNISAKINQQGNFYIGL